MAIPTLVIRPLTEWTIFVCFHGSEKSVLSGSEKSHFNAKQSLYVFFAKQYRPTLGPKVA